MAYKTAGRQGTAINVPAPVSSAYTVPNVAQFVIDQKVMTLSSGKFDIRDPQGNLLFDVKGKKPIALHTRRVLRDASGKVVVLMKKNTLTMHDRWTAYRGKDESELIYSLAKSAVWQMTPSFDIFLAANQTSRPDYVIKGDFFEHSYAILYNGVPVAETRKQLNMSSVFTGKDQYAVTIFPGVDHAFIASLIVIVDQVNQEDAKDAEKK